MEYKYFVEDAETNEWLYFENYYEPIHSFSGHHVGDMPAVHYLWTKDPNQAENFGDKEYAKLFIKNVVDKQLLEIMKDGSCTEMRNLTVTEHEFVLAVTPINTKTNGA